MPVPTLYSEAIFADYLVTALGDDIPAILGWDAGSPQVQEALADALIEYGDGTIGNVTGLKNLRRLRALGRRAIWRAVFGATAGKYDFSDSDAKFTRSQLHEQAKNALDLAEYECREWDPSYAVSIVSVKRTQDPYIVLPDAERVP